MRGGYFDAGIESAKREKFMTSMQPSLARGFLHDDVLFLAKQTYSYRYECKDAFLARLRSSSNAMMLIPIPKRIRNIRYNFKPSIVIMMLCVKVNMR